MFEAPRRRLYERLRRSLRWRTRGLRKFDMDIGVASVERDVIRFSDYPFAPSCVYPAGEVAAGSIAAVRPDTAPPSIQVGREVLFLDNEHRGALRRFAERHQLAIDATTTTNWSWINAPFLDQEHTAAERARHLEILALRGIPAAEVAALREEVRTQMMSYNFDTMLWEWVSLGLEDALAAMRPALVDEDFEAFYWRAMEVELRGAAPNMLGP